MTNLEFIREIGSGSFGSVWLARDLGIDALRAVKLVPPSAIPDLAAYNEEARVLNEVEHANIVSVYGTELGREVGDTPDVGMYAIVMEYMRDGSLDDAIEKGSVLLGEGLRRVSEACRGAEHVHACGYVHRDIKPANILLSGDVTKLSDFGLAALLHKGAGTPAGTPFFLAPEVASDGLVSAASDIYSLGVTLYEVVNGPGYLEWAGSSDAFERAVAKGKFPDRKLYAPFVPLALRRIIAKAMHVDRLKRYASAEDLSHAIRGVPVLCSWSQASVFPETWLGMGQFGLVRVVLDTKKGSLEVSRCKTAPGEFRKVNADCLRGASSKALHEHQEKIMQRITLEGR